MVMFVHRMDQLLSTIHDARGVPTIILGDFNEDHMREKNTRLVQLMCSHGYTQVVTKPTTDQRSLLDHVYVRGVKAQIAVDVIDTYYSDHDSVFITIY